MKTIVTILFIISTQSFALDIGNSAPDFALQAASGKSVKLSDYQGKTVVLEWLNHGCPFVRKHYDSNNMQALQKKYTDKGVIWLSIISSAEGKQGHVNAKEAAKEKGSNNSSATDILLDPTGKIGTMYEAKTTPHMYVVNSNRVLVYQGAIDDKPSTNTEDVKGATNYVAAALDATLAGKKIAMAQTKSYGCSVKY